MASPPVDSSCFLGHDAGYSTPSHRVPLYPKGTPLPPQATKNHLEINDDDWALLLIPYLDDMAAPSRKGRTRHPHSILPNLIPRSVTTARHIKVGTRSRPAPPRVLRSSLRQQPQPVMLMREHAPRKISHRSSNNADIACIKSLSPKVSASEKLVSLPPPPAASSRRIRRKSISAICA